MRGELDSQRKRERGAAFECEFDRVVGNDDAVADASGAVEGAGDAGVDDEVVTAPRERRRERARRLDRADAGDEPFDALARPPKIELGLDGAGEQNHGAPINLWVCSESRKRSGCAFA